MDIAVPISKLVVKNGFISATGQHRVPENAVKWGFLTTSRANQSLKWFDFYGPRDVLVFGDLCFCTKVDRGKSVSDAKDFAGVNVRGE
jgi:hypothetical protein